MKKILIIYTNYGTGHKMVAKALKDKIEKIEANSEVIMLDILSYSRPIINKFFAKTGKIVATKFRNFRKKLYDKKMYSKFNKKSRFYDFCIKLFWTKRIKNKLKQINADIIISTQVGPTGLIAGNKDFFPNIKLISVITDYGLHNMYTLYNEKIDEFYVPTKEIKQELANIGINKNKIK